jgi:Arc/MetJ-type ribon-helix-helix transcriptional regulator
MPATTVKLDANLLREIARVKSPKQTLSAFVRESLEADIRRRKLRAAAETYQRLLVENEAERADFEEWESAPLARAPRRVRK